MDDDTLISNHTPDNFAQNFYVIGQDLASNSIEELKECLNLLEKEKQRIEAEIDDKQSALQHAETFFK